MANSRFAGNYNANDFSFGNINAVPSLTITQGNATAGVSGTVTLAYGQTVAADGTVFAPPNVNAPILVGNGSNAESVTPTAVSNPTPGVYGSCTITGVFLNLHGGDSIASATFGLQEAINAAAAAGGGIVIVDARWYANGGTLAIINAASLPTNGTIKIQDNSASPVTTYAQRASSVSLVAAPSIPLITQVASLAGVTGTWTAVTTYVKFVYVTANGGLTLPSSEYSFTATVSLAIGGSGPIAATGAVGYLVFIGTTTNTDYQVAVSASSGTPIQCGSVLCFKIGTSFTSAAITTNATALVPATSNAFTTVQPMAFAAPHMAMPFQTVFSPFAVTGVVTAGTAKELGRVDLPTGFLNQIGRTVRIKGVGYVTPVSTATLILSMLLESVYGTTTTTMWTVTTAATSGTSAANFFFEIILQTAATGATGTLECHGCFLYGGATASTGVLVAAGDAIIAVSSAADLTKQDTISLQINSGTANLTQSQLRVLTVEVLA